MPRIEAVKLEYIGNAVKMTMNVDNCSNHSHSSGMLERISEKYNIDKHALIQFKIICHDKPSVVNNLLLLRLFKIDENDNRDYEITISSKELNIVNKHFRLNDKVWVEMCTYVKSVPPFHVAAKLAVISSDLTALHEDTDLTDFLLEGDDGAVHVHKAVLAAFSPVMRRMVAGTWRETTDARIKVPGTSKETLQHLKDYFYRHILPDKGSEHLVILASIYMIPHLEQKAIEKNLKTLTAQSACDLLDFAVLHKARGLQLAILEWIQNGYISVEKMKEFLNPMSLEEENDVDNQ